ncbi:septin and tuftelin-interacting protein 1 homolog 1-like isoform X2 [Arachis ipaensis]|uniref:septin and tuftelin-interacting protein 1 homolog 1-like isoform X2 n=1 Tax=Arachis ipaensis TaxID=130454 RepID=UPI000A2B1488|nr:septin and tuftelin-interacting protein 1 homolog 1-like isoform X2 [Arachis ipaensis]
MDEDQEMERFEMDNDFEEGQWINGEFYYKKRKEKRTQTRDDVLYGVFAGSDDDDDDDYSSKKLRKDLSKKQDLTKPVNFISTGTFMPNQDVVDNNRDSKEHCKKDGYVSEDRPGLGLGMGSASTSGAGLGFNSSNGDRNNGSDENIDDGDDHNFLPTAFGKKIKEGAMRREREREREKLEKKRGQRQSSDQDGFGNAGKFYNNGIGMKLLEKMGYRGGGLGKNEQGIVAPIEVKMRAKNSGIGFSDAREAPPPPLPVLQQQNKSTVGAVQPAASRTKERLWSKQSRLKKKKKEEEVYVTAEELLASKQEQNLEVVQKVYDMRGPQVRVYTNLSDLNAEEKAKEEDVPMPELQHNIGLLVRLAEADIQEIDRDLRRERETALSLKKEKDKLESEAAFQKRQLDNMEEIMSVLDQVDEESTSGTLTLDFLATCFSDLHKRYADSYKLCNLSCIACSYALPLFITVFQGWDPLRNPSHGLELVSTWKTVFDAVSWEQLMLQFIVPKLQLVLQEFEVNPASQKLDQFFWVIKWASVIPIHIMVDMMEKFFFPKWLEVLNHWLCSNPNFEEVMKWYNGWKELIPEELLANESIRFQINRGLDMMSQAVDGMEVFQPGLKEQRQYEAQQKAATYAQQQAAAALGGANADGVHDLSLKEVIEAHAQHHGLLFKIKPGRMHNGYQIYGFGNVSIIIDSLHQKVYAQHEETWSLESLQGLLELHNKSLGLSWYIYWNCVWHHCTTSRMDITPKE